MDSSLQSPEELLPQTFRYDEHSKQNHPNYLPRSQSSLESSSKASRNLNKPQINKALRIQASKASRTSTTNPQKGRTHEEHEERTKNF